MLRNYVRVALRNFLKRKAYSFINVAGLAIGVAGCILITLYVIHEISYDRFHEQSDRIYRVAQTYSSESRTETFASAPFPAGPALAAEYPQLIEKSVRFFNLQTPKLTLTNSENNQSFKESNFFFTDSTALDIFSIDLVDGDPRTALNNPNSLILSESTAVKYFGDEDPIGKDLRFEGRIWLTVTGVMKDLPANSHIDIDLLGNIDALRDFYGNFEQITSGWFWNPCWTYILLQEGVDVSELEDQLPFFADNYYHANIPQSEQVEIELQPLTDIHLHSNLESEIKSNGSILYVTLFSLVALLILGIACINYMNLATARAADRSREVGMRKVLGANRRRLFVQFMGESFLVSLLALLLALLIVQWMLPLFNNFMDLELSLNLLESWWLAAGMLILLIIAGFAAGIYPALYLSSFEPVRTLRNELTRSNKGKTFRRSLVMVQFVVSIILMIGTVIIYLQLDYMQSTEMGFDRDHVVVIPTDLTNTLWYYDEFKEQLLQSSDIWSVTGSSTILGALPATYFQMVPEGFSSDEPQSLPLIFTMHDFVETYEIDLIAGRSFSEEFGTDPGQAVVINERAVDYLGWNSPDDALGRSIVYSDQTHYVIGVTENFNHTSMRREIEPLVLKMPEGETTIVSRISYLSVRINPEQISSSLNYIEEIWDEFNTVHPFEYAFHDEELDAVYESEAAIGKVSASFALLSVFIACLGLFGLASYTTETRTREIGVRKAMGATTGHILALISKEFIYLIVAANLVAWPMAWYFVHRWLSDFPYRIDMGGSLLWIFFGVAVIAVIVSFIAVGYQSVKAARINPAEAVRNV